MAGLVPKGAAACDIGCDHGFVAIYLAEKKISPRVIAMDINKGPLLRAKEHIESMSLSTYIDIRLSNGLEKLETGEAECMIAAGMGGRLTVRIMSDYPEKLRSLRYLVLQPQSELSLVRRFLREQGFVIRREDMVLEEGKFYPMMLAERLPWEDGPASVAGDMRGKSGERMSGAADGSSGSGEMVSASGDARDVRYAYRESPEDEFGRRAYRESLEDEFGPRLIEDRHPVLVKYLDWWEGQQKKILAAVSAYPDRRARVEEELARISDVRKMMEGTYEVL